MTTVSVDGLVDCVRGSSSSPMALLPTSPRMAWDTSGPWLRLLVAETSSIYDQMAGLRLEFWRRWRETSSNLRWNRNQSSSGILFEVGGRCRAKTWTGMRGQDRFRRNRFRFPVRSSKVSAEKHLRLIRSDPPFSRRWFVERWTNSMAVLQTKVRPGHQISQLRPVVARSKKL